MLTSYHVIDGFLGEEAAREVYEFALSHERQFKPATVYGKSGDRLDDAERIALRLEGSWSAIKERFRAIVMERIAEIAAGAGNPAFRPDKIELEMAAHGDGGHFRRHIDTLTANHGKSWDRAISTVYYFGAAPARFTGGDLVLHALMGDGSVRIEPRADRLAIFPSIAPHEVEATLVESGKFADYRFSINCWLGQAC